MEQFSCKNVVCICFFFCIWKVGASMFLKKPSSFSSILNMFGEVRSLKKGCLWWVAPPCSTWIYLSRGSTGRSYTRARGFCCVLRCSAVKCQVCINYQCSMLNGGWDHMVETLN